jgi:hypothetical protein
MRRRWIIGLDLLCFVLMASCVTIREEIVVRRDLSGTYTLEEVWDRKAVREQIGDSDWEKSVKDAKARLPKWARFERHKTKDNDTHRYSFDFADLKDLRAKCGEQDAFDLAVRDLQWHGKGRTLVCRGSVDLRDPEQGLGPGPEEYIDSLTLRIKMPGRIKHTNAHKVTGRTVEWTWKSPAGAEAVEVTCWLLPPLWVFLAAGLGFVVVVGGATYARRRTRSARTTPTETAGEEQPPRE